MDGFWYHFRTKIAPTWPSKFQQKMLIFLNYFFSDFWSILASILGPIFLQNRLKYHGRVRHHYVFYHFRFLSPLWGTPWLRFPPIWIKFWRILERFLTYFLRPFWDFSKIFPVTLIAGFCLAGWL